MSNVESILAQAVKFKTIASKENENSSEFVAFKEFVKNSFPLLTARAEFNDVNNGFFFKIRGENHEKAPCLLMAHCDVVKEVGEWTHPPFSGDIVEGAVWGRGTVDTKGSLISILKAVEELISFGAKFSSDLYILSTANEEFSGEDAKRAAEHFKANGIRFGIVLDEGGAIMENPIGGVDGKFAMIAMCERAAIKYAAFSCGQNKALRIAKFISAIEKKKLYKAEFTPIVLEMFKKLTPKMKGGMKFIFKNLFFTKPIIKSVLPKLSPEAKAMVMPTITFSDLNAAEKSSVPFDGISIGVTVAYTYNVSLEKAVSKIERLAQKYGIKLSVLYSRGTVEPEKIDSDGYKMTAAAIEKTFSDVTPCPFLLFGGTDARSFTGISDSVIRFAPLALTKEQFGSFHKNNENISVSALIDAVEFYKNFIKAL